MEGRHLQFTARCFDGQKGQPHRRRVECIWSPSQIHSRKVISDAGQGGVLVAESLTMNRVLVLNKSLLVSAFLAWLFASAESVSGAEAIKHRILLCDYPQRIIEVS